ncbi:MAG: hypothetical protein DWQ05_18665 [Calditrichaeota bacterium]|nr:MAG: hypothetical protein DWQ05_18665 [Calditrichota bacterium]
MHKKISSCVVQTTIGKNVIKPMEDKILFLLDYCVILNLLFPSFFSLFFKVNYPTLYEAVENL